MKKRILLALAPLSLVAFYFAQGGLKNVSSPPRQPEAVEAQAKADVPVPMPPQPGQIRSPASAHPASKIKPAGLPPAERDSLESLSATLSQVGQASFSLNRLLEQLQKTGQQPLVARDANPDTGEMLIVRTKSPLPGTRYFHAQYFTSDDGERFVQHMSFEFKPGAEAMAAAIATIEKTFSNLSRPKIQRDDYVQWAWNEKYIVWVKKMNSMDLRDDPFNSYSESDDGTVRVAVELEIHGD